MLDAALLGPSLPAPGPTAARPAPAAEEAAASLFAGLLSAGTCAPAPAPGLPAPGGSARPAAPAFALWAGTLGAGGGAAALVPAERSGLGAITAAGEPGPAAPAATPAEPLPPAADAAESVPGEALAAAARDGGETPPVPAPAGYAALAARLATLLAQGQAPVAERAGPAVPAPGLPLPVAAAGIASLAAAPGEALPGLPAATTPAAADPAVRLQVATLLLREEATTLGEGRLTLRLDPPQLGRVEVALERVGDRLIVTFRAAQPEVERALRDGAGDLQQALAARGGRWQQIDIRFEGGRDGGGDAGDRSAADEDGAADEQPDRRRGRRDR